MQVHRGKTITTLLCLALVWSTYSVFVEKPTTIAEENAPSSAGGADVGAEQLKQFHALNARLQEAKRQKELDDESEESAAKKLADRLLEDAQGALKSKQYELATSFIDDAIKLYDDPRYTQFRNELTRAVRAAVNQAIDAGNLTEAERLNRLFSEFDANAALINTNRIAVLEQSGFEAGELKTLTIAGVEVNFHWAPAGTFAMGSPESEKGRHGDEKQHDVELTQGFWIAETETTQEPWQAVMGEIPVTLQVTISCPSIALLGTIAKSL